MNINEVKTVNFIKPTTLKNGKKEVVNSQLKEIDKDSRDIIRNYNISFHGLFNKREELPQFNAKEVEFNFRLEPNAEYYINEDDVIWAGDLRVDLSSEEMKNHLDKLKKGKEIIFGREENVLNGMTQNQSRQHFKIRKDKQGQLLLQDLSSINGTFLEKNLIVPTQNMVDFYLQSGKKYKLPIDSCIQIGNSIINLSYFRREIESLQEGQTLVFGTSRESDIPMNNPFMDGKHFSVERLRNEFLVKDLHSLNGTLYRGTATPNREPFSQDFSQITDIATLQQGIRTLIPNDSQLYLGQNFTIDLRNRNILNLLNQKKHILIGRNTNCDIVVPPFYDKVSRYHLELETDGYNIIAKDLNSSNHTQIIPKNKAKPFYNGSEKIELAQSNIGDCYLLSAIYALSRTDTGKQILENMITIDDYGNYYVSFNNEPPIVVQPEEIDGESYNNETKLSVNGDLGIKAIERAYAKKINNFKNTGQTMFLKIDNGGFVSKALKDLTGRSTKEYCLLLCNIDKTLTDIYRNRTQNTAITCTTPNKGKYNGHTDPQQRFISSHAYIVGNIDAQNRLIEIKNPHNTLNSYLITFDEFKKYFDYIYTTNI